MDFANTVESAIKEFYSSGNNEAHSWLLQVQASPEAWSFIWQLLNPSKSWEVQFFAATTLHAKLSKQWDEVPKNEYTALQEHILNSMKQSNTPKIILSKLCQTLAVFLANSSEDREPHKNIVEELNSILPYTSSFSLDLLLRVLSALPGEFARRHMKLRIGLACNWGKTTWLLHQVFTMFSPSQDNDNDMYLLGLECALSWLKMGLLPLETTGQIYSHLLVAAAYYAPLRQTHDSINTRGWEVVQECLTMIVTQSELHKRVQTLWQWAKELVSIAKQENAKYFCEILSAMGEAHSRSLLIALVDKSNETHKWTSEELIELLLQCSEQAGRYPTDETRSCIPFGFWYALQDDLTTLDQPLESQALLALKPIYARLAQALLRKAALPLSQKDAGDADERELFRCYRVDVADTLDYCYNVLRQDLLILLGQRLSQPPNDIQKWPDVESTLHAFAALADNVGTKENHYVPAIMDLILSHIPYDIYPKEVLASACSTLSSYAEWIGYHTDHRLEKVLQLITLGLTSGPVTAAPASMALKDVARECSSEFAPFAPSILSTIAHILPNVSPGSGEGLRLMFASGKLITTLPSIEAKLSHLDAILGLCIVKLRELLKEHVISARVAVVNQLKMISMFFSTSQDFIGKSVWYALLPLFRIIIDHPEWSQDDSTLQAMHTCAQKYLGSLMYAEIDAQPFLEILGNSYKRRPHPAALSLLRQLVLLFGRHPDNIVGPIFAELSGITLNGVKACQSVNGNLSDLSNLMEAYLLMLAQICKKNSGLLLMVPDQIPEMLKCGMAYLTLPEAPTAKAAAHFLTHAIMQSPHLQTFIQPIGQELVCAIMHCVGGQVPRSNLELHAEVLLALNKISLGWTAQWLRVAVDSQNGPEASQRQKETFIHNVLREKTSKLRMCEILQEFNLQCRQQTIGL